MQHLKLRSDGPFPGSISRVRERRKSARAGMGVLWRRSPDLNMRVMVGKMKEHELVLGIDRT